MDRLKAMASFVEIAERGSLTAAAHAQGASLPATVRSLAALEAHLGVRLMNRTTRRLALTEEGKRYLAHCHHVLAAVADAEAALRSEADEPAGPLTITAPVLFGQMHVAPAVTRFVQRHPRMRCNLKLYDRVVNLLEEGIDVGIRIGPLDDSSLVALPLGELRRVAVASPGFLARHGTPAHPRDLAGVDCIRFDLGGPPGWQFRDGGRPLTVEVGGPLSFNQAAPAVDACVAGLGVGRFLAYQVAPALTQGRLQVLLETFEPPPRPVHVVYPHARLVPARTRRFIDWIRAELGELPALSGLGQRQI